MKLIELTNRSPGSFSPLFTPPRTRHHARNREIEIQGCTPIHGAQNGGCKEKKQSFRMFRAIRIVAATIVLLFSAFSLSLRPFSFHSLPMRCRCDNLATVSSLLPQKITSFYIFFSFFASESCISCILFSFFARTLNMGLFSIETDSIIYQGTRLSKGTLIDSTWWNNRAATRK